MTLSAIPKIKASPGATVRNTSSTYDLKTSSGVLEDSRTEGIPPQMVIRFPQACRALARVIATIGADRIDETLPHFAAGDYAGLGSFVIETFLP